MPSPSAEALQSDPSIEIREAPQFSVRMVIVFPYTSAGWFAVIERTISYEKGDEIRK